VENNLIGRCGTYCGDCEWIEKTGCKGCQANEGQPFWGTCKVAVCSIEKKLNHCGLCKEVPCVKLTEAFNTPGHEDNGERLANLRNWAEGKNEFIKLGSYKNINVK
jgi:hypothetical protein